MQLLGTPVLKLGPNYSEIFSNDFFFEIIGLKKHQGVTNFFFSTLNFIFKDPFTKTNEDKGADQYDIIAHKQHLCRSTVELEALNNIYFLGQDEKIEEI